MFKKFNLDQKVVIITGGASLMGVRHIESVAYIRGIPIPFDIDENITIEKTKKIENKYDVS